MTSRSFNPYLYLPIGFPEGGSRPEYSFVTENIEEYIVYFTDASGYFPEGSELGQNALMFGFFPRNGYKPFEMSYDPRVSDTIAKIVQDFFLEKSRIAVYVCDTALNRQRGRHILFQMWNKHYNDGTIIVEVIAKRGFSYASLLYHQENPLREQIEQEIPEFKKKIDPYL